MFKANNNKPINNSDKANKIDKILVQSKKHLKFVESQIFEIIYLSKFLS